MVSCSAWKYASYLGSVDFQRSSMQSLCKELLFVAEFFSLFKYARKRNTLLRVAILSRAATVLIEVACLV